MVALGDAICRRFYAFVSLPHRFAAAFLSGLLISTWWTYASAWLLSGFSSPMLWGNLVYFITAIGVILWLRQKPLKAVPEIRTDIGKTEFEKWDWVFVGIFFLFVCWMAFATFNVTDGKVQIAQHQWSDFGSNISIMQSFALGNNFPTEYPHYSGEHIHYHFLFYFAAGNLEYLGLNPAMANNFLFILSSVSMLVLVMTLGVILFTSKLIGRIAAVIFFFHGTLSFIPFFSANGFANAWTAISNTRDFLPSGFPYRGELWGVWSQVVFINQRHLASSVGIFLVVLTFVLLRNRQWLFPSAVVDTPVPAEPEPVEKTEEKLVDEAPAAKPAEPESAPVEAKPAKRGARKHAKESTDLGDVQKFVIKQGPPEDTQKAQAPAQKAAKKPSSAAKKVKKKEPKVPKTKVNRPSPFTGVFSGSMDRLSPWVFSGVLLGLMPMWNGAVFMAAAGVLVMILLLFPMRRELFLLGLVAGIVAIPQVLYLRTWDTATPNAGPSLFHWGYTVENPTVLSVLWYLIFTFGFKWLLIAIALIAAKSFQRKFFIAITALIAVAFFMQFSDEVLANHKFLNVWLIMANVFAAFGLLLVWRLAYLKQLFLGKILAVILTVLITISGVIDLFPIRNSFWMEIPFVDDPLVKWVTENTDPKAVFLSYHWVNHRILLAGRKLYFGHPYYAWSAGYPTFQRDAIYRRMFEETNPQELFRLLKENNISYVAIDNDIRSGDVTKKANEAVYQAYFPKVFDDTENKYANLKIYQVTSSLGPANPAFPIPGQPAATPGQATGVNAFQGGSGNGNGQFSKPRGIAADSKGNIYVADQGNNRVQKFDADGKYLTSFGSPGEGEGQMKEVNGVLADAAGNVWIVDAGGDKSKLMKFTAEGKLIKEWRGPEDNPLYGPRDLAIGPDKLIYIVDQGRGRIVKFDPAKESFTGAFGSLGAGEGQFHEASGIAFAGNSVVVADAGNKRIQVFDMEGKFVRQWAVPNWQYDIDPWHYPDIVYDEASKKLFATSGWTGEVLAFDLEGNLVQGGFKPDEKLDNPSAVVISEVNKKRRLLVLTTGGCRVVPFDLGAAQTAKPSR